jgi:Zn-dependent protease
VGLIILLVTKFKFLLLGLTKLPTLVSMFAFFGVYWTAFGWPLALGLVISIYIHEMGHVAMLRRLGIPASAPLFVPGLGAFVLLKKRIDDPRVDAAIGLAGPVWGLGAGLAAYAVFAATDSRIWLAIAQLTGLINLFNLIPIWQLDGARGFHALTLVQRATIVVAVAVAFLLTGQKFLLLVGAVGVWSAIRRAEGPGDLRALATFIALVFALSWLSSLTVVQIAAGAP